MVAYACRLCGCLWGAALVLLAAVGGQGAVAPADVPLFHIAACVVSAGGQAPEGKKFTFRLGNKVATQSVVAGGAWSAPLAYTREDAEASVKGYPTSLLRDLVVAPPLHVFGVADPTVLEVRITLDETNEVVPYTARLVGGGVVPGLGLLGLLAWRDAQRRPHVAAMADYNKRYWAVLKAISVPVADRPKRFPIVDRFIAGDSDLNNLEDGIGSLTRAGFSVLHLPPDARWRAVLRQAGVTRVSHAIYNPPGYAFSYENDGKTITRDDLDAWGRSLAKPFLDAGFAPEDLAVYGISDEPGWYYPAQYARLQQSPEAMHRFRRYLAGRGLKPEELGAKNWDEVQPLGRSQAIELPARRRFYWTQRFITWDSTRHFADAAAAVQRAFARDIATPVNFNFFSGRLYVPGPVANNKAKTDPDAAMGGHDWLEFGRMAGDRRISTEDWFGDAQAYQWSFYCAKMRSAVARSGGDFGGLIVPRASGQLPDGIQQKILTVIGSGAKWLSYFVFGPEYTFPGNCYSEYLAVLPKMAETHAMIGKAEALLWPGRPAPSPVAILHPRSAELWDAKQVAVPTMIHDATNTSLNAATVDYMAEAFDLYLALQHANIPCDFVDEDDLSAVGLRGRKVLYVTEPNVPAEGQQGLLEWVKAGGTLVLVSNAATADRYDDPCDLLRSGLGLREQPRERLLLRNAEALTDAGAGTGARFGAFRAVGPRATFLAPPAAGALASFADGAPALVEAAAGKGAAVCFSWMPGLSYYRSGTFRRDALPTGFAAPLREMIAYPVRKAGVMPPVRLDRAMIETPLLLSEQGGALTVLNWSGAPQANVRCTVQLPWPVTSVRAVKAGKLAFTQARGAVTCTLPALAGADIVLFAR